MSAGKIGGVGPARRRLVAAVTSGGFAKKSSRFLMGTSQRLVAAVLAGGLVLSAGLVLAGAPAEADPTASTSDQIEQAKQAEALAAASVAEIEVMLSDLGERRQAAEQTAELAAEAYNAATEALSEAAAKAATALDAANQAGQSLEAARGDLARVAVSASDAQSGLAQFEPFLLANGIDEAMRRAELISVAGTTSGRATEHFAIAQQTATASQARADAAVAQREEIKTAAERAAAKAERASQELQKQEIEAESQHQAMLKELAAKRNTTIALEQKAEAERIAAANEAARRAAAERQAAAARREAAKQAEATPSPSQTPVDQNQPDAPAQDRSPDNQSDDQDKVDSPQADPTPKLESPPVNSGTISSSDAGQAAVEWARLQIGKPYQWGGSGPDSFDCSGLTSQAWLNGGGKSIPRTAADQYASAAKVAFDEMRPGDLIFWGNSAESIHHVAIYSGDGMMVEAPRPGQTLTEIPIRWSGVYGYAGRY